MPAPERPVVLFLSGHDPGGGAGLQADAEAAAALGAHALTVVTAHTVQDSRDVRRVVAPDPALLREQLDTLLGDFVVRAVKIGLLAGAASLPAILGALARVRAPVVLDPVLRAGGGAELSSPLLEPETLRSLLPHVEVITPNAAEARRLAPAAAEPEACAAALLDLGARNVLVTGGDEPGEAVVNRWYAAGRPPRAFAWPRLPGPFHGAGCTLAAAVASLLARGAPLGSALEDAQAYTKRALARSYATGRGRLIPGRAE
jgi:hydroxymethylpyrimidine/phosphomethylpyrimidine kinase